MWYRFCCTMCSTFPALRLMLMYNKCYENLLVSYLNIMWRGEGGTFIVIIRHNQCLAGENGTCLSKNRFDWTIWRAPAGKLLAALHKINWRIFFSCMQMFFTAFVLCILSLFKQKTKQFRENLMAKVKKPNQISHLSWISLIGIWSTQPRSNAFRVGYLYMLNGIGT